MEKYMNVDVDKIYQDILDKKINEALDKDIVSAETIIKGLVNDISVEINNMSSVIKYRVSFLDKEIDRIRTKLLNGYNEKKDSSLKGKNFSINNSLLNDIQDLQSKYQYTINMLQDFLEILKARSSGDPEFMLNSLLQSLKNANKRF